MTVSGGQRPLGPRAQQHLESPAYTMSLRALDAQEVDEGLGGQWGQQGQRGQKGQKGQRSPPPLPRPVFAEDALTVARTADPGAPPLGILTQGIWGRA